MHIKYFYDNNKLHMKLYFHSKTVYPICLIRSTIRNKDISYV